MFFFQKQLGSFDKSIDFFFVLEIISPEWDTNHMRVSVEMFVKNSTVKRSETAIFFVYAANTPSEKNPHVASLIV